MRTSTTIGAGFWVLAALLTAAGDARADGDEVPAQALRQEAVGLEVTPVAGFRTRLGVDATAGAGATVRLLRHRWTNAYWTPVQAGGFIGGDGFDEVIFAHVMTEGGAVLHEGPLAFELGVGLGAGILAIAVGNDCDGTCRAGGKGAFVSPVARVLFKDAAPYSLGAVLRAEIPLADPSGSGFGYFVGDGTMVMAGLDVGYGW